MRVEVRLFAYAKQVYGKNAVTVDLPPRATVSELRRQLVDEIPALAPVIGRMLIAVNSEYASDETPLQNGDDVACIPPVSGG